MTSFVRPTIIGLLVMTIASGGPHVLVARGANPPASHCVALIEPRLPDHAVSRVTAGPCFDHPADAVAFATKDKVRLPKAARVDAVAHAIREHQDTAIEATLRVGDQTEVSVADAGQSVIGWDFEHLNREGRSLVWYANTSVGCIGIDSAHAYQHSTMPTINGFNWNDKVSSAEAFGGCNYFIHYENYFSGFQKDCGTYCGYIGDALNDRTSTERLYRVP